MTSTESKEVEKLNVEEKSNKDKDKPSSPQPSHMMDGEYAALMETNGKECESWYYFIRREGNEENLQFLQDQLEKIDWYILDDLSTFDLDLEHFVSAKTAKEMTKLELNSYAFHRKFDGKLKKIDFEFKKKDLKKNERMMEKVFDLIGYGQIEDYITDEDLDSEDLTENNSSDSATDSDETEEESEESSSDDEKRKKKEKSKKGIPPALAKNAGELPGWAKAKRRARPHR